MSNRIVSARIELRYADGTTYPFEIVTTEATVETDVDEMEMPPEEGWRTVAPGAKSVRVNLAGLIKQGSAEPAEG